MENEYYPHGWLQILDIVGMVIAPLIVTLPIFLLAIKTYQTASSTGSDYTDTIVLLIVALGILILFGYMFGSTLKRYVCHQATRDEVKAVRMGYSIFIPGILIILIVFFPIFS